MLLKFSSYGAWALEHADSVAACHEISVPEQGSNLCPPAVGGRFLSHWTTREVSHDGVYKVVMEPWGKERRKQQTG